MGQYWKLVCWDNRQTGEDLGKIGEFYADRDYRLLPLLHKTRTPTRLVELFPKLLAGGHSRFSEFELLPRDIIMRICRALIEVCLDDVYHLALASPAFFEPAWTTFVKEKSWSGKRIVCIGDYSRTYPPGMLTQEEVTALNREKEVALEPRDYEYLFDRAECFEVSPLLAATPSIYRPGEWLFEYLPGYTRILPRECTWSITRAVDKPYGGILRNHTARVYVDLDYLETITELSIWTLVIIQTMWSEFCSCPMDCIREGCGGPWAGHRFDVTTEDDVDEAWADVTQDMAEKFRGYEEW